MFTPSSSKTDSARSQVKFSIGCESLESRALLAAGVTSTGSTLIQAVAQLQTDLRAIHAASSVTVSELTALGTALKTDQADATGRPTSASLSTLQTELLTEAQAGTLDTQTLLSDEASILTSAGVPTADITATTTAQSAIFTASGVTGTKLKTIETDEQAIQNALPVYHGGGNNLVGVNTALIGSVLNVPLGALSHLNGHHPTSTGGTSTNAVQVAKAKLETDLHALAAKSQVMVSQLSTLSTAFETARKAATSKPAAASITALKIEISNEAKAGTLNASTIEADVAAVLTSAGVPSADSTAVTQALNAVIVSSGITGTDLQTIYNDEQALKAAIAASTPAGHNSRT